MLSSDVAASIEIDGIFKRHVINTHLMRVLLFQFYFLPRVPLPGQEPRPWPCSAMWSNESLFDWMLWCPWQPMGLTKWLIAIFAAGCREKNKLNVLVIFILILFITTDFIVRSQVWKMQRFTNDEVIMAPVLYESHLATSHLETSTQCLVLFFYDLISKHNDTNFLYGIMTLCPTHPKTKPPYLLQWQQHELLGLGHLHKVLQDVLVSWLEQVAAGVRVSEAPDAQAVWGVQLAEQELAARVPHAVELQQAGRRQQRLGGEGGDGGVTPPNPNTTWCHGASCRIFFFTCTLPSPTTISAV